MASHTRAFYAAVVLLSFGAAAVLYMLRGVSFEYSPPAGCDVFAMAAGA